MCTVIDKDADDNNDNIDIVIDNIDIVIDNIDIVIDVRCDIFRLYIIYMHRNFEN